MSARPSPAETPPRPTSAGDRRQFVAATFVDAVGSGLWLPMALLFLVHGQGLRLVDAGAALSAGALVGLLSGPVAGNVVDRIGPPAALLTSNSLGLAAFCCYPLVHTGWQVTLVAAANGIADRLFWTGNAPFVSLLTTGRDTDRVLGSQTIGRFLGAGLGAGVSALLPAATPPGTYHVLAFANAASYGLSLVLIARLVPRLRGQAGAAARVPGRWSAVLRDRPYVGLCLTNGLFALASCCKSAILPILVRDVLHGPGWVPGVAIASGAVVVVVGQHPVTALMRRWSRATGLLLAAAVYGAGFLALALVAAVPVSAAVVVILVASPVLALGDAIFGPAMISAAAQAAPPSARGRASAVYQMSWGAANTLAPLLLTSLLGVGNAVLWLTVTGVCALAVPAVLRLKATLPAGVLDA